MKGATRRPVRKRLRLKGYDYSQAQFYYVTICTADRLCILGKVTNSVVELSPLGTIVRDEWLRLPRLSRWIAIDESVVMPNHFHGIVDLTGEDSDITTAPDSRVRLGRILAAFKSRTAVAINRARGTPGRPVWQRGFHDHIVRNDRSLEAIRAYIRGNPSEWERDPLFVGRGTT